MDRDLTAELAAKRRTGAVIERLGAIRQIASLITGRAVPLTVRSLVHEAFGAPEYSRMSVIANRRGEIGEQLKGLSDADWRHTTAALLPHIAPSVESALRTIIRRPYQDGITRKPFRAPHSPATVADVRGRWLLHITLLLGDYDADIRWISERAAQLAGWSGPTDIGWLLAGAIDVGDATGREVQDILQSSALGEHQTGRMGRHVTQALMSCAQPTAWEFVEKLLLAAQRQEGLRQAILEAVDESHPEAFRRMLRLILDENLSRFSSVVRAADTWFGFMWDGASGVKIESLLTRVLLFLENPAARWAALDESDAETVYLALWGIAFEDIDAAIAPASALLAAKTPELRFIATHFLVQSLWSTALQPLVSVLGDPDLRVAARALDIFGTDLTSAVDGERLFGQLEELIARVPGRSTMVDGLVWPWWKRKLERRHIAAAMAANAAAVKGERLLPYVPDLDPASRAAFVRRAAGISSPWAAAPATTRRKFSAAERLVTLDLLGDPSADVRTAAFEAMREVRVESDEVDRLVDLLGRKPGDLRSAALARLRLLPDGALIAAADRLLSDDSDLRRLAGLELLRDAAEADRAPREVHARMQQYATNRALTDQEQAHITAAVSEHIEVASRDDALGLVDVSKLRKWPAPRTRGIEIVTAGARASLKSLAQLVLTHQGTEIRTASGEVKLLVESVYWGFGPRKREDVETGEVSIPLGTIWRSWLRQRPDTLRDADGLELLRALMAPESDAGLWNASDVQQVRGLGQWSAGSRFLRGLCEWCVAWEPSPHGSAFLVDGFENAIEDISTADYREMAEKRASSIHAFFNISGDRDPYRIKLDTADTWLKRFRWWRDLFPASVKTEHAERLYGLMRHFEERSGGFGALRITMDDFLAVYRAGAVGEDEFVNLLVGRAGHQPGSSLLRTASARKPPRELASHPELLRQVDRCRRRVVEVETGRGDRETSVSGLAMELRSTGGLETIQQAIPALGKTHFARNFGWSASGASRQETLSHLVVRSLPGEDDTPERFAQWARDAKLREARLVELAVYAPQWAAHVNHVLGWPGLDGAVWWIQAHTKDDRSWQLQEMKEIWAAEVSERTPLSAADLTDGAVDVAWFASVYSDLGPERWKALDTAAKYAASSGGHTRARLFAGAMSGQVSREELLARIDESRHQDSVRALGLVPLADGDRRDDDLLERYMRLQEFRRQSRKFGSQRQQSEGRAVTIGLANLARTAGFSDPQRLQWAMEQRAVADLARGPLVLNRGDVSVTLSIDADGVPSLRTLKNGKALKALPAALKKDEEVAELRARLQELKRQSSRVRDVLEDAMRRGDVFEANELGTLLQHPILAPALSKLVFIGDDIAGYLDDEGRVLRDHAGSKHIVGHAEKIHIAHPHDLLTRGDWSDWQRECFRTERIQPFKQVFRELYPLTETERGTRRTRRYAGHQVNPRQALALLGGRGWVARPEEGVSRTFHEEGLTARLGFEEAFHTPAEIEGLTLDDVTFTRKGEWTELPLDDLPARLFSEVMRDLDLVVSVAHRGGVDPEATASTIEMRAALLQETCELLGLDNVEVSGSHAMVRGTLGRYSVHLGSAGVLLMPGTALPIVAVHSQHRGRLFLPFADDDPRTAEVISKVLLLARDREIRDPNILEWIRAAGGSLAQ